MSNDPNTTPTDAEVFATGSIDELYLNRALHLIKLHITEERTEQNADLHYAALYIVTVAQRHGMMLK